MTDKNLKFTFICHLGLSNREDDQDQRLSVDQHGNFYLFDWSGDSPDQTDDGPCMWDISRPITVSMGGCHVPVLCLGREHPESFNGVTHAGMVKFLAEVAQRNPALGNLRMELSGFDDSASAHQLRALLELGPRVTS